MSAVIYTLAMYRSRKQVKEELRRQGHKVSEYSARDISVMAGVWAAMHRDELIADAREMISKSPELTKMYEKEQRQRAKLLTNAQQTKPPISTTSAVQNTSAERRAEQ